MKRSADVFEVYSRVYGATARRLDMPVVMRNGQRSPLRGAPSGGVSIDSVVRARGAFRKVGAWRRVRALQPRSAVPGVVSIFPLKKGVTMPFFRDFSLLFYDFS